MTDSPTTTTSSTASDDIWRSLVAWIRRRGGTVHPDLRLRELGTDDHRGVFATRDIAPGETLLELPSNNASIDGRHMPLEYDPDGVDHKASSTTTTTSASLHNNRRKASPWLRCLGAYYRAQRQQDLDDDDKHDSWKPYLDSLPSSYETVASWDDDQVNAYLAGTCTQGGSAVSWHADPNLIRERYRNQIRPYLQRVFADAVAMNGDDAPPSEDDEEEELKRFMTASACLSTRCFHLQATTAPRNDDDDDDDAKRPASTHRHDDDDDDDETTYTGPFLLPGVDLLNHVASGDPRHVTTLHRTSHGGGFCCKAERPVVAGQEILHSYGDALTSSQFLQTFGFVPHERITRAVTVPRKPNDDDGTDPESVAHDPTMTTTTPALLRKQDVLETCWNVIASDLPTRLAAAMRDDDDTEDEAWPVAVDRRRTADFISDDLIVDARHDPLTDEIVTTACVAFLPVCAYREAAQALLGVGILEDFFLGTLVCTSLLQVIQAKMEQYRPITWQGTVHTDDAALLRQLLSSSSTTTDVDRLRLMYGLTVRLEEKASLRALRRRVVETLARLDADSPDDITQATKRQKLGTG